MRRQVKREFGSISDAMTKARLVVKFVKKAFQGYIEYSGIGIGLFPINWPSLDHCWSMTQ